MAAMGKLIAQNKKAYFDYFVEEKYEAGLSLEKGEIFAEGLHISPYEKGNIFNKDPMRPKKLLMHKKEILRLFGLVKQDGYALIPLSLYFKGPRVKLELGLCKGKKQYDKRQTIAKRDSDREIRRRMMN